MLKIKNCFLGSGREAYNTEEMPLYNANRISIWHKKVPSLVSSIDIP